MESSTDKTKREIINHLTSNQWLYQYSIFCDVSDMDHKTAKVLAIEWFDIFDDIKFRDYLRKANDTAILFVIRTNLIRNRPNVKQLYITLFCNEKLYLDDVIYKYIDSDEVTNINVLFRNVKAEKIASTVSALKNQKLHDLKFLGNKNRYSLINKKLLKNYKVKEELEAAKEREYDIRHGLYYEND